MSRFLLSLGTVAFAATFYALMLKGWRSRQRRQGDLPPPAVATDPHPSLLLGAVPGLFVGTTFTGDWMDRVAVHHLGDRATGELVLASDGVHLEREGLPELFVPWADVQSAQLDAAIAGKVVSGGMLAITWTLGGRSLTSGFRATDHREHVRLAAAVTSMATADPVREETA